MRIRSIAAASVLAGAAVLGGASIASADTVATGGTLNFGTHVGSVMSPVTTKTDICNSRGGAGFLNPTYSATCVDAHRTALHYINVHNHNHNHLHNVDWY